MSRHKQRRHGLHTRSCTPEQRRSKQSGYICSSICRCVTEHRLIVLEIYIYLTKLPRCQTTRSTHPCPSVGLRLCKRLSIQFYPENLLKRLIVLVHGAVESPLRFISMTPLRVSGRFLAADTMFFRKQRLLIRMRIGVGLGNCGSYG